MSDGESRQVIQQLLLTNCENVDSSLQAVSLASHASPRTPAVLRAQASASKKFFSTRMDYASVENHQTIPPSHALLKSSGKLLLHNRRTLIRGLTPIASRTRVYRGNLPRVRQLALPRLVCHNFCESPDHFFTTSGVNYKWSARSTVLCNFFQIKLVQ